MSKYFDGELLSGYEDLEEIQKESDKKFIKHIVDILNTKDQQIVDLEAKLAESEKKFKASKDAIKFQSEEQKEWMDKYFDTAIKLEKANKQLAEKDKEIKHRHWAIKSGVYIQDKISFAVEQLEKVKDTAENILDDAIKNCSLNESYYDNLLDKIDNQIEELKKEMK